MKVVQIVGSFACNNIEADAHCLPPFTEKGVNNITSIQRDNLYLMIVEEGYKWMEEHAAEGEKPGCLLKVFEPVAEKIEVWMVVLFSFDFMILKFIRCVLIPLIHFISHDYK